MKKYCLSGLLLLIVSVLVIGCATYQPFQPYKPLDLNSLLQSGAYVPKVDSFLVIFDSSGSMDETYKGRIKVDIARNFVHRMNQTIPDMKLTAGLRKFSGTSNPFAKRTALIYGMTNYTKAGLDNALKTIKWGIGDTPLSYAINKGTGDLKAAPGQIAVIVVSDGRSTDGAPVSAAANMKKTYGDRVCIYTVLIADSKVGKKNMDAIAQAGGCGFATTEDSTSSAEGMADFVKKVFLKQMAKSNDDDKDGVLNDKDKCPNTPRGAKVDARGCWVIEGIYFDTDKAIIKPVSYKNLNEVVAVLRRNPGVDVRIDGHTDFRASEAYNQKLSEARANAVKNYLIDAGIERKRLTAKGFGELKPAYPNTSPENMAKNRRVEITPTRR
ncbi:OmpA family protein [Thermodesulfobacteriota bacterium]